MKIIYLKLEGLFLILMRQTILVVKRTKKDTQNETRKSTRKPTKKETQKDITNVKLIQTIMIIIFYK